MKAFRLVFTIILLLFATTSPVWADTLILKNGDRVTGSFEGGTARVVRFRTFYGEVKEYDVLSVQQIQFSNEQKTTVLPATSKLDTANTAFTFPAGSKMTIRMIDSISGENQTAGSLFLASVEKPMRSGDVDVVPKGADVWGRVTSSDPLGLELTLIVVNGIPYYITTAEYRVAETLDIPSETELEFTLKEPLVVAAREDS
jgi:hypothetical protein